MTPLKTNLEAAQTETRPEEPRQRFQPIKPRGGSPTAASDEVIRGRGRNPDYYEDESMPESDGVDPLQIQQCCVMLEQVEKTGKNPITLEWFRDMALLGTGHRWTESLAYRQAVVTKAINAGALITSSIPNPKSPQHPTTTVKLNRNSDYAKTATRRFQPIRPRGGESASEIILRDRGRL